MPCTPSDPRWRAPSYLEKRRSRCPGEKLDRVFAVRLRGGSEGILNPGGALPVRGPAAGRSIEGVLSTFAPAACRSFLRQGRTTAVRASDTRPGQHRRSQQHSLHRGPSIARTKAATRPSVSPSEHLPHGQRRPEPARGRPAAGSQTTRSTGSLQRADQVRDRKLRPG